MLQVSPKMLTRLDELEQDILARRGRAEAEQWLGGHQLAVATLGEVWAQMGFEHFRDGVYVLDLNLVALDNALQELRGRFDQYRQ